MPKKKLLAKYTIEAYKDEDGQGVVERTNEGFNAFELLGHLMVVQDDILDQIKGLVKPDIVKRKVVKK